MSIRKITDDLLFVGASDRRLALFESAYPVPEGVSYNAYLLRDEKNVLFDTVDRAVADTFPDGNCRGAGRSRSGLCCRPAHGAGSLCYAGGGAYPLAERRCRVQQEDRHPAESVFPGLDLDRTHKTGR